MKYNRRGGEESRAGGGYGVSQPLAVLTDQVVQHLVASPFWPEITDEPTARATLTRLRHHTRPKAGRPPGRPRVTRTCPTCTTPFSVQAYAVKTFCSFRCWEQVYGRQRVRSSP